MHKAAHCNQEVRKNDMKEKFAIPAVGAIIVKKVADSRNSADG